MQTDPPPTLEPGSRVTARGRSWTVVTRETFDRCAAVCLQAPGRGHGALTRTLLTPYDELRSAEPVPRFRMRRLDRLLTALRRLALLERPFGAPEPEACGRIDILPHQLEPALAVADGATRLLIADGVGLGKTIQAGLILRQLAGRGISFRALVATPAGLRAQWHDELRRHFLLDAVIADRAWLARAVRELPSDINPWALPAIYIASYDFLKQPEVLQPLEELVWDALVVDEAHNAAPRTARRAALHAVGQRARRVVLLTATPHAGDEEQFESLLMFGRVDDGENPPVTFHRTAADVGVLPKRRTVLLPVRTQPAEARMHRLLDAYTSLIAAEARARGDRGARLAAIVLRKRALSSAASLARSAARRLALLSGAEAVPSPQLTLPFGDEDPLGDEVTDHVLAAPGLADARHEIVILRTVAQAATEAAEAESKLRFLFRLLARVREPAIVFTEYRDTLEHIGSALARAGIETALLHGGLVEAERGRVLREFNESGRLLLATDAASEGLNLQARCRLVVHFELPWNPARLEQRTGRVDRLGQRRRVHEILLVARDSAERLVLGPLVARAGAAGRAVRGSGTFERLSESHVAAAILDGEPLPSAEPAAENTEGPWSQAARFQASRLLSLRAAFGGAGSKLRGVGPAHDILFCGRRRSTSPDRFTVVYLVELLNNAEEVAHAEVFAVAVPTLSGRDLPFLRSRGGLDGLRAWMAGVEPMVRHTTATRVRERLRAVAVQIEKTDVALARREAAIAASASSAARDLVQAGLFDRRALKAGERRESAARALLEDLRPHPPSSPAIRLRLLALVPR